MALESYAYWLSRGAPLGVKLKGQGYPRLAPPNRPADYARGSLVYQQHCTACHQVDGGGINGIPALWGDDSS